MVDPGNPNNHGNGSELTSISAGSPSGNGKLPTKEELQLAEAMKATRSDVSGITVPFPMR